MKSNNHHAHIVHHIPGRMRLKVPGAKENANLLDQVRLALNGVEGVREIEVNPVTGSLLIRYDREDHDDFHAAVSHHTGLKNTEPVHPPRVNEIDETIDRMEKEAEFLASRSQTARVVVDFLRDLDLKVKQTTNNAIDLKVVVPLALALYSITVIEITAATPMWVTLGLFSFNHFLELHEHDGESAPAPETDAGDDAPAKPVRKSRSLRQS